MHPIVRLVVGLVLGFIGGAVAMMACHMATTLVYPPPEGLDVMDPGQKDAFNAWLETLPDGAFVLTALCHWIGAAVGAVIAMFVAGRRSLWPALIIGGLFMLGGIMNAMQIPHPAWYPWVDIPGYPIVGFLIGKLLVRPSAEDSSGASA